MKVFDIITATNLFEGRKKKKRRSKKRIQNLLARTHHGFRTFYGGYYPHGWGWGSGWGMNGSGGGGGNGGGGGE